MKTITKNSLKIIASLTFVLLLNGCVTKNPNGTYNSKFSYHTYNTLQHQEQEQRRALTHIANIRLQNINQAPTAKNVIHKNVLAQNVRYNQKFQPYNYQRQHAPREASNQTSFLLNTIEEDARSHLGKKYVWAGNGPENFDCSGFTKFVFRDNGMYLPRRAVQQSKVGKLIDRNNLQKGDLIFFDSSKSSEIKHVGIYLGNGKFIHASSGKNRGVVIGTINEGYHDKHFKWGRRLTPTCTLYAGR